MSNWDSLPEVHDATHLLGLDADEVMIRVPLAVSAAAVTGAIAAPLADGVAAVGTATKYAREDHVHPTDTTRAPVDSPVFTGTPTAPTAPAFNSSTQIATTAYVDAQSVTFNRLGV